MKTKLLTAVVGLALAQVSHGVTITSPLTLQKQFVAGILNGQPGDSSPATEKGYVQAILDLSLGQKTGVSGVEGVYEANTVFDYSGTVTSDGVQVDPPDGVVSIPAGWGGALAKYDGKNAGYVLFLFGGQASTIPEFPYDFWTTQTDQYQISHYTLFNGTGGLTVTQQSVPEGGVGLGLLGLLLAGMGWARKRLAA